MNDGKFAVLILDNSCSSSLALNLYHKNVHCGESLSYGIPKATRSFRVFNNVNNVREIYDEIIIMHFIKVVFCVEPELSIRHIKLYVNIYVLFVVF